MGDHRFELVQGVGVEEVLSTSLLSEIVLEGLDPCSTDGLSKPPRSTEDLDEERATDQLDVTRSCQRVSAVWFGTCSGRSRPVPIPNTYVLRKLKFWSLSVAQTLGAELSPLTRRGTSR